MKIGQFDLDREILIIAEIGNNHEGSYTLAEEMIGLAAHAGADAVKFQTIIPDRLVSPRQEERIQQLGRFQLSYDEFEKLAQVACQENVLFLSTPFDIQSAQFLKPLVPAFKIASSDNDFYPLIHVIAQTGKPILLSSGLADMAGIKRTIEFITDTWYKDEIAQELAVLHCVTCYPALPEDANLFAIKRLQSLGVSVGYSDHTLGIDAAVLSIALGARIVEKHFTIDKNYSDFRDHQLAADPQDFAQLVQRIGQAVELLGTGKKMVSDCETPVTELVRRSIVASRDLDSGIVLSWDDLNWVRPGGGLAPGQEKAILGKRLTRPIPRGDRISPDDVAGNPEEDPGQCAV